MPHRILSRFTEPAYAALRIVAGLMFSLHGAQKILGLLATDPSPEVGSQKWFGGVIELVGGALVALGLFTRCAAFVTSGTMAVAYLQFHWKFEFGNAFWPIVNRGELALLYAFTFLLIACRGAGVASLDRWLGRRDAAPAQRP